MRSSITTILRWLRRSIRPLNDAQQRVADRQRARQLDAGRLHRLPVLATGSARASRDRRPSPGRRRRAPPPASAPRPSCGRCCPAARCRTADGHGAGRRRCRDHRVDRRVGVRHQPGPVAADRLEAADRAPDREQRSMPLADRRPDGGGVGTGQRREGRTARHRRAAGAGHGRGRYSSLRGAGRRGCPRRAAPGSPRSRRCARQGPGAVAAGRAR